MTFEEHTVLAKQSPERVGFDWECCDNFEYINILAATKCGFFVHVKAALVLYQFCFHKTEMFNR